MLAVDLSCRRGEVWRDSITSHAEGVPSICRSETLFPRLLLGPLHPWHSLIGLMGYRCSQVANWLQRMQPVGNTPPHYYLPQPEPPSWLGPSSWFATTDFSKKWTKSVVMEPKTKHSFWHAEFAFHWQKNPMHFDLVKTVWHGVDKPRCSLTLDGDRD